MQHKRGLSHWSDTFCGSESPPPFGRHKSLSNIFSTPHSSLPPSNSEKTDIESTHSSNLSHQQQGNNKAIPPDALYAMENSKNCNGNNVINMLDESKVSEMLGDGLVWADDEYGDDDE